MSTRSTLARYAEAWRAGDLATVVGAGADDVVFRRDRDLVDGFWGA